MSNEVTIIIGIVSIVIWIVLSKEISASPKEKTKDNRRARLMILMSAGILSTVILAVSLFQDIQL